MKKSSSALFMKMMKTDTTKTMNLNQALYLLLQLFHRQTHSEKPSGMKHFQLTRMATLMPTLTAHGHLELPMLFCLDHPTQ